MPSTLIQACPLCGLRFPNGALFDLHIREDHLKRNRPAETDHDDSGDTGTSQVRAGAPSQGNGRASSQPRTTDEMNTVTATRRPRSGQAMTTLRRAIGTLGHVNDELLRASEAIIRSARARQPGRRPDAPADKDAQVASAAKTADRAA